MKKLYIITGANGHLGNTIIRKLANTDAMVRGLILPSEQAKNVNNIQYYKGDVRDLESLRILFENTEQMEVILIHTAGIVNISNHTTTPMHEVNVTGTNHIISLCMEYGVKRMIYVSSVHAIPEHDHLEVLKEVKSFSSELVTGGYAKTKAQATQAVLDAAHKGLDVVVVHPSGILGPYDTSGNHLVQMIRDYMNGKLPACVHGGYDFVDVRDVATGCLAAVEKGRCGECYILSNRHYEIKDVLQIAKKVCGGKRIPVVPIWIAKSMAPLIEWASKIQNIRPLYTKYSLYTLSSNDRFDHSKATLELNYYPRDLCQTIRDTVVWLNNQAEAV